MEILIGFLICSSLVISFTLGVYFGYRYNKTSTEKEATITKLEKEQLKRQRGFNNIMSYDVNVAMGTTEQLEE